MRSKSAGWSAAVLFAVLVFFVDILSALPVSSRPLADEPAKGGFLLVGQYSAEKNLYGQKLYGQNLYRQNLHGHSLYEQDLFGPEAALDSVAVGSVVEMTAQVLAADSIASQPVKTKNPTGALLRSLAVPGWGQLYNEQYIKSGLVLAVEGLLVAGAIVEHRRAEDDDDLSQDATQSDEVRDAAWRRYSRRVDKRNAYLWYLAGFKFLSMIDAYVDAHLYRFDEGPFSFNVRPGLEDNLDVVVVVRYRMW